jgi:DNA-binding NtrC family response regulator
MSPPRVPGVRRLHLLLQQVREPVFLLDGRRRLAYVNAAWEALTGFAAADVVGLECAPPGPVREGGLAGLAGSFHPPPEVVPDGQAAGAPALVVHADGERRWVRVEYWPLRHARGHVAAVLGMVRPADAAPLAADSATGRLQSELERLRERLRARHAGEPFLGRGPAHARLLDQIAAASRSGAPALLVGEPGTGRRHAARQIALQRAPGAPLLPYDCDALPAEVLERELFGGPIDRESTATPVGLRLPEGSTLLLVDVDAFPRDLQARLVAAIDGRHGRPRSQPVQVLATTRHDPDALLRDERFRPEFYYALTTLVLRLPPLRERLDELPLLAQHFLERANVARDRRRAGLDAAALTALAEYDWPGNLRELARVIDAAHAAAAGDVVTASDLPAAIRGHLGAAYTPPPLPPRITPLDETLTQLERRLIEQALAKARQNKSRAAELLDISRPRLYRRIKELGLPDVPEPPDDADARPAGDPAVASRPER